MANDQAPNLLLDGVHTLKLQRVAELAVDVVLLV
jgi:hypothetical protein